MLNIYIESVNCSQNYYMKNLILTSFFLALISFTVHGQDSFESQIKEVTVFLNGAQISRTAKVNLSQGENIIYLTGLTQNMDYSSVQVEGNSAYGILSVKAQVNYGQTTKDSPLITRKKDSLNDLRFTLDMRNSMERVYQEELSLIKSNKMIKGEDAVLLVDDIEEMADFFRDRLLEVEYKLLELRDEKKKINEDIYRLTNEINQESSLRNRNTGEVILRLDAKKAGAANVDFSFMAYGAGWYPVYDLRTEDTQDDIEMRYKAKVYQNTGNDWDDVKLILSTGNPRQGGQAPELHPWYLYLYEQEYLKKARADNYNYNASQNQSITLYDSVGEGDISVFGADSFEQIQILNNIVNTEFSINIPYSIPSDNQEYDVEVQRLQVPVSYQYLAIPKLDKDAFLIANLRDWRSYNLMPGESNIYFKGTFVGTAFIDPGITEDTLALSLGRDPSIVVERESIKDMCKTQNLGLKKRTTKAYRITVRNNKSVNVDLRLEDQIPLSNVGEMEVNVEEISGANYDEETGKLTWDFNLAPGDSKEVVIKFNVKYPKSKSISNL